MEHYLLLAVLFSSALVEALLAAELALAFTGEHHKLALQALPLLTPATHHKGGLLTCWEYRTYTLNTLQYSHYTIDYNTVTTQ